MNTFLTKEDLKLKEEFEKFAKDKIAPLAPALVSGKTDIGSIFKLLAQQSYLSLNILNSYGGKEYTLLPIVLLAEALAHYEASIVIYFAYHIAAIELIKTYGSASQKTTFLPKLAQGSLIGTLAYSGLGNSSTKATMQNDNLTVAGQKINIPINSIVSAPGSSQTDQLCLMLVSTDKGLVIVDNLSSPQIKITRQHSPMGLEALSLASINFENYSFNKKALLGEIEDLDKERLAFAHSIVKIILAAAALGMVEHALKASTDYAKIGEHNGQQLSKSEAIQWKLADTAVDTSAARLLIYRAACSKDENKDKFIRYSTMAKTYATKIARHHTGESLQIILPFLQNNDSTLIRFYLESKMLETFDTSNEEEKVLLSQLLGI